MLSAIMDICVTNALTLSRLWESLWSVSKVESSVRARLAIPGLSCWEASVLDIGLSCWKASVLERFILLGSFSFGQVYPAGELQFWAWVYPAGRLQFWAWVYPAGRLRFWAWVYPAGKLRFWAWVYPAGKLQVYPPGKFQWHFTCGFDFRHSLWLPFVGGFAVLRGLNQLLIGVLYTQIDFF